jgi:hypothetical protein
LRDLKLPNIIPVWNTNWRDCCSEGAYNNPLFSRSGKFRKEESQQHIEPCPSLKQSLEKSSHYLVIGWQICFRPLPPGFCGSMAPKAGTIAVS